WKSRKHRGIPTLPQPRLRLAYQPKPDISLATKTGHFNLLPTGEKFFTCCPGASVAASEFPPTARMSLVVGENPHCTHPMREDVKKKHFSTPLREIPEWRLA